MGWESDALAALSCGNQKRVVQLFDGCTKRLASRVHRTPKDFDSDDESWEGGGAFYNNAPDAEVSSREFGRVWKGDTIIELTLHCLRLQDIQKAQILSALIGCGADMSRVKSACESSDGAGAWIWRNSVVGRKGVQKAIDRGWAAKVTSSSPLDPPAHLSNNVKPPMSPNMRGAAAAATVKDDLRKDLKPVTAAHLRRVRKGLIDGADYYKEWFSKSELVLTRPETIKGITSADRLSHLRAHLRAEREKVDVQRQKIEALEAQLGHERRTMHESMENASRLTQQIRAVEENRDHLQSTYNWTDSDSESD
jgi:hypothetical protein